MAVVPFRSGAAATKTVKVRPIVLVADAAPLAYLAGVDALGTLGRVGTRVEMLDLVLDGALRAASAEGHARLVAWVQSGTEQRLVGIAATATCCIATTTATSLTPDDAAMLLNDTPYMVAGWLALRLLDLSKPVLILHAGGLVGHAAVAQARDGQVTEAKLDAFLDLAAGLAAPDAPESG